MNKWYFEINKGKILGFFPKLKDWKYKITEIKRIRSLEQNKLYWGYIIKFIVLQYQEVWEIYSKDYIHSKLKRALLPRKQIRSEFNKRKFVWVSWTTTELTTKQFTEYIDRIKILCEFWKLDQIPWLSKLEPFVIPDITEEELLEWIDKII